MDGAECIERKLHDCKQNEQGMTKQDLEEIIQRIGALEAQINRKKDNSDNAAITGKDNGTNIGFRDKVRRKPTKSASFNGRSTSKSRRRSPYRHTVPSDKGILIGIIKAHDILID